MQESCTCGSVRGASGNRRPYRDRITADREPLVDAVHEVDDSCGARRRSSERMATSGEVSRERTARMARETIRGSCFLMTMWRQSAV